MLPKGGHAKSIREAGTQAQPAPHGIVRCETLAEISHLPPPRCHELEGQRAGQFAVDIDKNYRLIFTPDHDPVPRKDDGGIDLAQVTEITILEITDYH